MSKRRIAIACQGGGSQTAFTAGVLKALFEAGIHTSQEIVAFSGTSGGAICATLAWSSLIGATNGGPALSKGLLDFWQDNATQYLHEELLNSMWVGTLRMMESGLLPQSNAPVAGMVWPALTALLPHQNFYDLKSLLESHIDFETIAGWDRTVGPALLVGAADILNGTFKKFSSRKGEIKIDALLASTAVPALFPAVSIGKDYYWDGLLADNPPMDELLDENWVGAHNLPDEVWIIQINPQTCPAVPVIPGAISDRRNEMIGNQSLEQDRQKIELINRLLAAGAFTPEYMAKYRPVTLRTIAMSERLQRELDYATKLDRSRYFIDELIRDGEIQGHGFLAELDGP